MEDSKHWCNPIRFLEMSLRWLANGQDGLDKITWKVESMNIGGSIGRDFGKAQTGQQWSRQGVWNPSRSKHYWTYGTVEPGAGGSGVLKKQLGR